MLVRQVYDDKLAQFAYLVGCPATGEAAVIDPERDVDRYFELAHKLRLRIVAAVDTHIHADYLSGLREIAERGAWAYASDEGGPEWRYEWLRGSSYPHRLLKDGDRFDVGNVEFEAVHTPGHTPELPKGEPLLVHCNSGGRSAAAVSLLERFGFTAVDVDDRIANYRETSLVGITA